jgi:DNA-binding beta-propeller fold protein YncE
MTFRILSTLVGTILLIALLGCASGGAPNPHEQPQRLSVIFDMGQSAGASSRSLSPEKTVGGYTVQLESAAGGFDPVTKELTGYVRVHNRSAGSTATMYDTQARIVSISAIDGATDVFTFEVEVSWYAEDPAGDPVYDAGTGQHGDFSSNDGDWNYGSINVGKESAFLPWTFTLEAWVAPPPTAFSLDATYSRTGAVSTWSQPSGVALADNGHLFVSDTKHHQLVEFDAAGVHISTYADGLPQVDCDSLNSPYGLAVIPETNPSYNGHIVVANTGANIAVRYAPGASTWFATNSVPLSSPLDATATRTGDIFIADNANHRVAWVTLEPFATGSSSHADFSQPAGVTVGPDGLLYISDRVSKKIIKLRIVRNEFGAINELAHVSTWSPTGSGALTTPRGICVDYAGYVYVADAGASKQVVVFDAAGAFVRSLSLSYTPYDVDVSPDGQYLYVAGGATGSGSVQRYTITR